MKGEYTWKFYMQKSISKVYKGKVPYKALVDIDLSIQEGEFVGIMGPSGSGKTTLLNMVSTIDSPSSGEIFNKWYKSFPIIIRRFSVIPQKTIRICFSII